MRDLVAVHPKTPADVVNRLARVCVEPYRDECVRLLARRPDLPAEAETALLAQGRESVRLQLAGKSTIQLPTALALAKDESTEVRLALADQTPHGQVLAILRRDRDEEVRYRAATRIVTAL